MSRSREVLRKAVSYRHPLEWIAVQIGTFTAWSFLYIRISIRWTVPMSFCLRCCRSVNVEINGQPSAVVRFCEVFSLTVMPPSPGDCGEPGALMLPLSHVTRLGLVDAITDS